VEVLVLAGAATRLWLDLSRTVPSLAHTHACFAAVDSLHLYALPRRR
jgi:hypothetical protein